MSSVPLARTTRTMLHAAYNFTCVYCQNARSTTLDHIIPLCAGGARTNLQNLVPACEKCNTTKDCKRLDKEMEMHLQFMASKVAKDIREFYENLPELIAFAKMYNNPPPWKMQLQKLQFQTA